MRIAIERRTGRKRFKRKLVVRRESPAGRNRIRLSKLSDRLRLRRGTYRVSVTAVDGDGAPRRDSFRVLKHS